MHIVYVIAPRGGPESFVQTIIPSLQAHGHRISVIYTTRISPPSALPEGVRVEFASPGRWHYYAAKFVGKFQELPRRLRAREHATAIAQAVQRLEHNGRVDLVEITEGIPVAPLQKRWRVIVRAHGADWTFRLFCEESTWKLERRWIRAETKQLLHANAAVAISKHLSDYLQEMCGLPKGYIQTIPYPIELDLFSPAPSSLAPKFPQLLTIGRIEQRKGTDILFQALPKLWRKFPEVRAALLGNEAGLRRDDLLSSLPEPKRPLVSFPGFVSRERLPELLEQATVYVAPTQYETFGYTILEAMACGVPVVATNVGAIPELVEDGATGLLVPPRDANALADAISDLLADEPRRLKMGERARQKAVECYDLKKIVLRNLAVYQRALDG